MRKDRHRVKKKSLGKKEARGTVDKGLKKGYHVKQKREDDKNEEIKEESRRKRRREKSRNMEKRKRERSRDRKKE